MAGDEGPQSERVRRRSETAASGVGRRDGAPSAPQRLHRYWPDWDWSSPWLSTHAGIFLLDARDEGIAVDSHAGESVTISSEYRATGRYRRHQPIRQPGARLDSAIASRWWTICGGPGRLNERGEDELLQVAPR